jgi:SAM-dependent methyltransferase
MTIPAAELGVAGEQYAGRCAVCGSFETFELRSHSLREGYCCPTCRASLRYRDQAAAIVAAMSLRRAQSLVQLIAEPSFRALDIYEPGIIGPFRALLGDLRGYETSYFWTDREPGQMHNGQRCENLESLTYPDESFDLMLTSDIFEHVRQPWTAFGEVMRVLRPGGRHIFSVPISWPSATPTSSRVDVVGDRDLHLRPRHYHGSPTDSAGSLVYTDYGGDLDVRLRELGWEVVVRDGLWTNASFEARRPLT